jgi:hypothetical protein
MIQYEYYTLTNEIYLQEGLLNQLGVDGWELATHVYDKKSQSHVYTFKKQKPLTGAATSSNPFGITGTTNSKFFRARHSEDDIFWENPSLYAKIENAIIEWSNDNTKTAGELTRQILKLIK